MSNVSKLLQFLAAAPAGTMVPVESLRELLSDDRGAVGDVLSETTRMLTPTEAAEWLHTHIGGRKRTSAAIRKVMRTGFRGVVLQSYSYGRERRTTEADLWTFVVKIGSVPRPPAQRQGAVSVTGPLGTAGFQVECDVDPANEIVAAHERFRRRRAPNPQGSVPAPRRTGSG